MPNTARKLDLGQQPSPAGGPVAQGGPVADLQRSIEGRLTGDEALAPPPATPFDRAAVLVSRLAGLAALGGGYAAVTLWWLG